MFTYDKSLVRNYVENYLLSHISKIKRSNKYWVLKCKICGDSKKNKSKMRGYYYKATTSFHCFNCDQSAEGLYVITKLFGVDYKIVLKDYLDFIRTDYSSPVEEEIQKPTKKKIKIPKNEDLPKKCIDFLKKRKILDAPYLNGLRFSYDNDKNKLIIPWNEGIYQTRSMGTTLGVKYKFEPYNQEKTVFGLENVNPNENIFFLEGVFDKLFVYNSICIGGIYPTAHQFEILEKELIDKNKLIWFSDNPYIDESVRKKLPKIFKKYGNIKVFHWNKNNKYKDVNEMIIGENNVNLFNEHYINSNIISLDKLLVEIKFHKI